MPFLISLVVALLIVGLLLWVLDQLPGIDPAIKHIIRVVVIVVCVIWVIYALLGFAGMASFPAFPRR